MRPVEMAKWRLAFIYHFQRSRPPDLAPHHKKFIEALPACWLDQLVTNGEQTQGRFPPTRWTWLAAAGTEDEEKRMAGLEQFLQLYYPALEAHLRLQYGLPEADAQDCLQDFVLNKVIGRQLLLRVSRERGRFRTYLCHALGHFVIDRIRRSAAAKRAPNEAAVPLDELSRSQLHELLAQAEEPFDREFFFEVMHLALDRMRARCAETNRVVLWEIFESRILEQAMRDRQPVPYSKLLPLLGLDTAAQAANLQTTAKRMFVRCLRSVVREYTRNDRDVADELQQLQRLLAVKP